MAKEMAVQEQVIMSKIYLIRGQKLMLDNDLADMYGVETRRLNEQVKPNSDRFPNDFMFQLTRAEYENLKSQNATSSWGGRRTLPYGVYRAWRINVVQRIEQLGSDTGKY